MDEKELKTSTKQRVFIIIIAIIMVGSIIASYAAIVLSGVMQNKNEEESQVDEAKVAEYQEAYDKKLKEFQEATNKDYKKFLGYKGKVVKGYNENSANEGGVKTKDIEKGSGDTVSEDNYLAYYIGWCADESVFDSSFDDTENPTGFRIAIDPSVGMIEGWNQGVKGMKMGGIREITIPGELAYGDSKEICGGTNKPLKFMVMTVANKDPLKKLSKELEEATMRLQYASYGMDYDEVMNSSATSE
ncbi:FKBP-type peptidyl-prolyl cis-trans isomerase [Candidatus Saccharibacteria bacterium]|nr:FKBP-type peptidyl-prolyl cis-trans isomerase [Candidatus Saccharibacteria bacterium]